MASKSLARICHRFVKLARNSTPVTSRWKSTAASPPATDSPTRVVRPETSQADLLTDIGTRKIFSEEHDIFRRSVRKLMQELSLKLDEYEEAGQMPRDAWEKAGAHGMLGVNTPAEFGGIGGDFLSSAIVLEELNYVNMSSFGGITVHSEIVMPYITHYGSQEQIQKYIPDMTAGRKIGCIAMTEPGAGSDLQGIQTNAKQDGNHWILNGSKVFITNGIISDFVLVVAKTNSGAKSAAHGLSIFIVDKGTEGFSVGPNLKKMGIKGGDTAELFFEDVKLPASAVLGGENKGFYYLMQELPQERLCVAVIAVAHAEFMFEETRKYVRGRKAFGKSISNLQTVQHKLAEMKTEICIARTFIDQCLVLHCDRLLDSQTASMAKYWTTDLQTKIADQCVQLHGGCGYMWGYPIARAFVDARAQPIYAGSNEIMKELIARSIVKD